MQLQKLVYIAHGIHLGIYERPLINEFVEAWEYGPVIPSLYHAFKAYGNREIKDYYRTVEYGLTEEIIPIVTDSDTTEFLSLIWDTYSKFSAIQLSNLTHEDDSPWSTTIKPYRERGTVVPKGKDIAENIITEYYKNKLGRIGEQG